MPTVKGFFRKLDSGAKKFFGKGGTLDKTFSKGGSAEKFINQVGQGIDTGVKAVGNVVNKVGEYAGRAGKIAGELAPALAVIPGVGPELAAGAMAAGELSKKIGGAAGRAKNVLGKVQDTKNKVQGALLNPQKAITHGAMPGAGGSGILAPMPPQPEPTNLMDNLPFA